MQNQYLSGIKQTNGCRLWQNPLANVEFSVPERPIEVFIKNLPKELSELDILPHFERFGPIYQFRLLVDYENCNRGFAYLIYFHHKSALECFDLMQYFFIKPGVMLGVERSLERSHLLALNVPSMLTNAEIEAGFRNVYPQMARLVVKRDEAEKFGNCRAVIEFKDHQTALEAKSWSGVGSVNLWNQNVKILWAQKDQINDFLSDSNEVKLIVVHNVPEICDMEEFGRMMHPYVDPIEIISIRPMKTDYVIEFASTQAAFSIMSAFEGQFIGFNRVSTEWLLKVANFADFDFELRCICLANYCEPPIFIYGRIVTVTNVQLVSVIIKNNRKNQFVTILLEMSYEGLVDIHSRVCEVLVLYLMELKELPTQNLIFKCSKEYALLAGVVNDLSVATVTASTTIMNRPFYMYMEELAALSKMSYTMIASQMLDQIYNEYKMILKEKNIFHQLISGISCEGKILGCIDPGYRMGKPMKYELDSRQMILVLCDTNSLSNIDQECVPHLLNFPKFGAPKYFKLDKIQLIPLINAQRADVHHTFRPFIEFNQVDSFSSLKNFWQEGSEPVSPPPSGSHQLPAVSTPLQKPRLAVFEAFTNFAEEDKRDSKDSFDFANFMGRNRDNLTKLNCLWPK